MTPAVVCFVVRMIRDRATLSGGTPLRDPWA